MANASAGLPVPFFWAECDSCARAKLAPAAATIRAIFLMVRLETDTSFRYQCNHRPYHSLAGMDRITLYISLAAVALVIALFSTLYIGHDQRGATVAMTDMLPHDAGAPRTSPSDPPASFEARFHFGA